MNSLSSLPPPSFATAPAAAPADLAARSDATSSWATLDGAGSGAPLHVSATSAQRSIDDIERDFLAALCENPPA